MSENRAPALKRGLELLELIYQLYPIGFNRLQQESGLNTSSLNRLLKVLIEEDHIVKNIEGKYEPGIRLFTLIYGHSIWEPLEFTIHETLLNISKRFKVTALFIVFIQSGSHILDKVASPDNVAMREPGDTLLDYQRNPWGHLYLSQLNEQDRHVFTDEIDPPMLEASLQFIKEKGYADDHSKIAENLRRIAIPVYGKNGKLIAAFAAGSYINLITDTKVSAIIEELRKKAHLLSKMFQEDKK